MYWHCGRRSCWNTTHISSIGCWSRLRDFRRYTSFVSASTALGDKLRQKQIPYVEITPKNESGKKRMAHHGSRWIFRSESDTIKFSREPGPWVGLMSRDGKDFLWIKKNNDPDFTIRMVGR